MIKCLKMKKLFFVLILILSCFAASGQNNISVLSFQPLPNDLDARLHHPRRDQNGELSAIIKVVTTQTGFEWEPDGLGIVASVPKTGEIWLYVPRGARRITIKHPHLGILRNYYYDHPIEAGSVYEMVLSTAEVELVVKESEVVLQWFSILSEPEGANVYIDDKFEGLTPFYRRLPEGTYNYIVEMPRYYTQAGQVEIRGDKSDLDIKLLPAFGKMQIASVPENGMLIYLNGNNTGLTTPDTLILDSNKEHQVKLMSQWFEPQEKTVTVGDGEKSFELFEMVPTEFGHLTVTTEPEADVYINNHLVGTGKTTTRLNPGYYEVAARLDKYYTALKDILINPTEDQEIKLDLKPRTGSLEVISNPFNARVLIDGKYVTNTPATIEDLLIGEYKVLLRLDGFADITNTVTINENATTRINERLPAGMRFSVYSDPPGADLYLNDEHQGQTPVHINILYGDYKLRLELGDRDIQQNITLDKRSKNDWNFEFKDFQEPEMIIVQGGSFVMGCTREHRKICLNDEKPTQQVLLNNFFISKYPVTQDLWQSVMGEDSHLVNNCPDCPVTQVSWYDTQEFIKRINQITKKNYRLPTEAEWEYAARGGLMGNSTLYAGSDNLTYVGWFLENSDGIIHQVGEKRPNELDIYDMSGNAWEWCNDWYGPYTPEGKQNPTGPSTGTMKVARGGAFASDSQSCRTTSRNRSNPDSRSTLLGFRLVLDI